MCVWKFPTLQRVGSIVGQRSTINAMPDVGLLEGRTSEIGLDAESREMALYLANPGMTMAVQNVCDQALVAFLQTVLHVAYNDNLDIWRKHKKLLAFDPDYDIDMGFGLHAGWAIEGAIGSPHKVDASYLSPNVNMSARLEAATKQFGVKLLFSGVFHSLLQPDIQEMCRLLDRVTVKGSLVPMDIYTFDIQVVPLENGTDKTKLRPETLRRSLVTVTQSKIALQGLVADPDGEINVNPLISPRARILESLKSKLRGNKSAKVVPEQADIPLIEGGKSQKYTAEFLVDRVIELQEHLPRGFVASYNQASRAYINGEWHYQSVWTWLPFGPSKHLWMYSICQNNTCVLLVSLFRLLSLQSVSVSSYPFPLP